MSSHFRRSGYIGYAYISIWVIGFLVFQLYPFIISFFYSFTQFSVLTKPHWVGVANYVRMFTDDTLFPKSARVTAVYVLMTVPLKLAFALIIALVLNMKLRLINTYRTLMYLPSIMGGSVAIALVWRAMFMKQGIVNQFLSVAHIPSTAWLVNPSTALFSISLIQIWQFGSSMVIFLAGLKQIPKELYESARVDGATRLIEFFRITLPMLTSLIFFNVIMQTINAFQAFTEASVVTGGGPLNATYLYSLMLYQQAFSFFHMGYASALSWVLFAVILLFTLTIFRTAKSWVYYEDQGR